MKKRTEILRGLLDSAERFATPYLLQGRSGAEGQVSNFDLAHSRRVSHYAIELGRAVDLDVEVLGITGWLHDIGYAGKFDGNAHNYEDVKDMKVRHMLIGAELARQFVDLPDVLSLLTTARRDRIVHLVGVHDKLDELKDPDEIVFMEADTLGAIDVAYVTPSFDRENAMKYLEGLRRKREPLFQTKRGKKHLERLLIDFVAYFA